MVRQLRLILKLIRNRNHQVLLLQVVQLNHQRLKSTSTTTKVSSINLKLLSFIVTTHLIKQLIFKMTKWPQINYGSGWYNAGRADTLKAMNSLEIWNSSSQKYQMLNLGKYQGISVSKLNSILKGKGTLSRSRTSCI